MAGERSGLAWLASPLPILGLALMGLNDHWWRVAWPNALTFKLSDVGVLLYLPALLCALASLVPNPVRPRPLSRGGVWVSVLLAGGALALLNLSPAAAELYTRCLEWILGAHRYTPDPSDCLALVALPVVLRNGLRRCPGEADEIFPSRAAQVRPS